MFDSDIGERSSEGELVETWQRFVQGLLGVLALIGANIAAALKWPVETRRIVVDITSWYWHCMTGLWIYVLVLFSFAAQ